MSARRGARAQASTAGARRRSTAPPAPAAHLYTLVNRSCCRCTSSMTLRKASSCRQAVGASEPRRSEQQAAGGGAQLQTHVEGGQAVRRALRHLLQQLYARLAEHGGRREALAAGWSAGSCRGCGLWAGRGLSRFEQRC